MNSNNLHDFDFDTMQQELSSANINTAAYHSDDSSSATNEKEYVEEVEVDDEDMNYYLKKNTQITMTAQSILDKIDNLQEERSINGDFLSVMNKNDNMNGFNSSKTTSSVSSSTSISSNVESTTGLNEDVTTTSNENESQEMPVLMHAGLTTPIQIDDFELETNEERFVSKA